MMKLFAPLLVFLISLSAAGAPKCASAVNPLQRKIELAFDRGVPEDKKQRIVQLVDKVMIQSNNLSFPEKIEFSMDAPSFIEGGAAHLMEDKIVLSALALKLSPASFDALISHEITHLIVVRGLHDSAKKTTLRDQLRKTNDLVEQTMLLNTHLPIAELLCDLMAVLVTGNRSAVKDLLNEIVDLAKTDPALQKAVSKSFQDQPEDLSRRDFAVSFQDSRWEDYRPKDMIYNALNQLRAYSGARIEKIPPEKRSPFFRALLESLDPVYAGGQLDYLLSFEGAPAANKALIEYLDQKLVSP